jgi:hypothetical protein
MERVPEHAAFQAINCRKVAPRAAVDAHGEVSILEQIRHGQTFGRADIKGIDEAAAVLAALPGALRSEIKDHRLSGICSSELRMSLLYTLGHARSRSVTLGHARSRSVTLGHARSRSVTLARKALCASSAD